MALNTSGITRTIVLGIPNVCWYFKCLLGILLVFFTKLTFIVFMVRCFVLLSHFWIVQNCELSKSTSLLLSVSLTLECVKILSWSISFFSTSFVSLMMFCARLLSELIILLSTHHVTNHLICGNKLSWTINCNLILKIKLFEKNFYFSPAFFSFWSVKI